MSQFGDNLADLIDATPDRVEGKVEVDQIYAHYQHEHPEFHHPDGGQAFYLRDPLLLKVRDYYGSLAKAVLPGKTRAAMIANVEALSLEVYNRAPWEFGDLRGSGHPSVTEDGATVYDRKPLVHRLDAEELADKSHLRYLFDPHRYDYDRKEA